VTKISNKKYKSLKTTHLFAASNDISLFLLKHS